MTYAIDFADVQAAAETIRPHVLKTPLISRPPLNSATGAELFFKCEQLQHVQAFKARGACNAVFSLQEEEASRGVVAHSSGNHAAALARAARLRGIEAHIAMPHNSATIKIQAVRDYGVEPIFCEPNAEARQAKADEIVAATGATFIHPFDNVHVMAGQGTTALEMLDQAANLDVLIIPVGGGGLLSGCAIVAKALNPSMKIIGAEPAWADDAFRSKQTGKIEPALRYDTVADGLRTPLGEFTFPIINDLVDEILLASEEQILTATKDMLLKAHLLIEPSGALPLAVVQAHKKRFAGQRIGLVISGGNIETALLQQLV